jgi:hypothetical protein
MVFVAPPQFAASRIRPIIISVLHLCFMPFDNTDCPKFAKMIDNSNAMEEKVSTRNKKYLFMQTVGCDQGRNHYHLHLFHAY